MAVLPFFVFGNMVPSLQIMSDIYLHIYIYIDIYTYKKLLQSNMIDIWDPVLSCLAEVVRISSVGVVGILVLRLDRGHRG